MSKVFGTFVRLQRERLLRNDREYSLRKVAERIGIEPSYLSKIERNQQPPPSVATIQLLARELEVDSDKLLGLACKLASDVKAMILRRQLLMCGVIRMLDKMSAKAIVQLLKDSPAGSSRR